MAQKAVKLDKGATRFYKGLLRLLLKKNLPFMVGGTFAFSAYTGIFRQAKDMDLFTTQETYSQLLRVAHDFGYETELLDEHWIAKIHKNDYTADVIFAEKNGLNNVTQQWFDRSPVKDILGFTVQLMPLEEMIKSKAFIQNKNRYDGPDVIHLFLRQGKAIDWKWLLSLMEPHWEVAFAHVINFLFVYPADRKIIPSWVMDYFQEKLKKLLHTSIREKQITRGLLYSAQYKVSIERWGYRDISQKFFETPT